MIITKFCWITLEPYQKILNYLQLSVLRPLINTMIKIQKATASGKERTRARIYPRGASTKRGFPPRRKKFTTIREKEQEREREREQPRCRPTIIESQPLLYNEANLSCQVSRSLMNAVFTISRSERQPVKRRTLSGRNSKIIRRRMHREKTRWTQPGQTRRGTTSGRRQRGETARTKEHYARNRVRSRVEMAGVRVYSFVRA